MEAASRFLNIDLINRHKNSLNGIDKKIDKESLFANIRADLKKNNATIVSH